MTARAIHPAELLADAFATYVTTWAEEMAVDAGVRQWLQPLAHRLSLAVSEGHVCLPLEDVADKGKLPPLETMREALLDSGLVCTPEKLRLLPLVLDADNRLYLHRYFDYERTLARQLLALQESLPVDTAAVATHLTAFFGKAAPDGSADWQRVAAALAMRQRLTVISGGPGTGKTTTVANILACLLSASLETRIVLAAPTGKAAMRMLQAIRAQAERFPPDVLARLPGEAFTLHRLLGVTSTAGVFRHHAENPLALDVLVVDEASMIDLAMAAQLADALPPHARLILLGDKDQLSAVEAGAVFSELSANPSLSKACVADLAAMTGMAAARILPPTVPSPAPLADSTVWLTQNFRFAADSGISRLALAIRDGQMGDALAVLTNSPDGSVNWLSQEATTALPESVAAFVRSGYADYLAAVEAHAEGKQAMQAVFDAFERFRVLCATHEGSHGVSSVNALMAASCRNVMPPAPVQGEWYAGRPVMVRRNDYVLRLFNGDIGIALPDGEGGLQVYFPADAGGFRTISRLRLPEHETAFAMTVHKSQGSEFESLLILMPPRVLPVITRELLYTAVTRARKQVALACPEAVLEEGMLLSLRKHSGLLARLVEGDA